MTNHFTHPTSVAIRKAPLSDKAWLLGAHVHKEACDDGIGVFHGEVFPNTKSYILQNIAKVPFLLGNWIAGFRGKVDGH